MLLYLATSSSGHYFQIEILKRLQRESFSEQMKQRDRLDKVERLLSFYKLSKGSPFQEASTHVRAEVDVLGAVLMMGGIDQRHADALDRAEVRTGIHTRFTFETTMRQNDTLVADFVACQEGGKNVGNISGRSLSLAKLSYVANIGDWFYAIAVPVGAQCRDFDIARNYSHKVQSNLMCACNLHCIPISVVLWHTKCYCVTIS